MSKEKSTCDIASCLLSYLEKRRVTFERQITPHIYMDLRELRTSIKKLRTIFKIVELIEPKKFHQKKESKYTRKIFQTCGQIRDIQSLRIYLTPEKGFDELLEKLEATEEKLQKKLKKDIKQYRKKHSKKLPKQTKKIDDILHKKTPGQILDTMREKADFLIEKTHASCKKELTESKLHTIRKDLKKAYYTLRMMDKCCGHTFEHISLAQMQALLRELGSWHDQTVIAAFLKKHKKTSLESARHLKKLEKEIYAYINKFPKECKKILGS